MSNTNAAGVKYVTGGLSGVCFGKDSVALTGFNGATPTTRRSGANGAAIAISTGTASGSALVASLQSVIDAHSVLLNEIRATLVQKGLHAGA